MAPTQPPRIVTQDPTDSNIEESSDDHFSSASEGGSEAPKSPIPITRVERVDDKPAYGEVPGTPSYAKRVYDAVPDEIEVVPEGQRSRSGTRTGTRSRAVSNLSLSEGYHGSTGSPVPKTIVERVDDKPAHGEVEGTAAHELRLADAEPDEVKKVQDPNGSKVATMSAEPVETESATRSFFHNMWEGNGAIRPGPAVEDEDDEPADDAEQETGDDFDEYAIGDDDDFGDFDDVDQTPVPEPEPISRPEQPPDLPDMPEVDFSTTEARNATIDRYLEKIFADESRPKTAQPTEADLQPPTAFLSERSLSLWRQLVSPPPMQPPNWTRSRIRRLFLVSLGVPVDLDEILPPSKQKRLILPNINIATSPRASSVMDRLKDNPNNNSTTSLDSRSGAPHPQRPKKQPRGPPRPPDFDLNAAAILSTTTDEALAGYEDAELQEHLHTLESLNKQASSVLEYWLVKRDESTKEKEALEGVIENLVGFVKGRRGK